MDNSNWIGLGVAALTLLFIFYVEAPPKNTVIEDLMQSTMAIHDEAMQELGGMNHVGLALKAELSGPDSLSARADSIREVLRLMKGAEEDMFSWMEKFKAPENLPDEAAKAYLEDQHQKIRKNNQDIKAALAAGNRLLEKE